MNKTIITGTTALAAFGALTVPANAEEVMTQEQLDTAVAEAVVELDNATATSNETQAAVDEQTTVVEQAEAVVEQANSTVADAEIARDSAVSDVMKAQSAEVEAANKVETTEALIEAAKANEASVKEEVAAKEAELQAAADAASSSQTVTEQTVVKSYSHAASSDETRRNKEWLEQVTYNGEEEVVIELTDDQKAILEIEGYVPYEPNTDRITELMAQYINEIRELNGIEGRVFAGDADMRGFINDRLAEMTELAERNGSFYVLSHTSNLRDAYDAGATRTTKFSGENLNTYIYNDNNVAQRRPYSDEELAYNMTLDWFNDYENIVYGTNPTDGQKPVAEAVHKAREVGIENLTDAEQKLLAKMYGHNYMITTARGAISFGATYETNVYNYLGTSAGSRFRAVLHGFTTQEERFDAYNYKNEHLSVVLNDEGKLGLRHDGEVITFLPKRTFTYVTTTTKTIADTTSAAAQALEDFKRTATVKLANAASAVVDAEKLASDAKAELEAATADVRKATTHAVQAQSDFTLATDQVKEAEDALETAELKLTELIAINKAAQDNKSDAEARLTALKSIIIQKQVDEIVENGGVPVPVTNEGGDIVEYVPAGTPIVEAPAVEITKPVAKTPVAEATVVETTKPDAETPVVETPAVETTKPVAETPVAETPVVETAKPAAETPAVETAKPVVETTKPVVETPEVVTPIVGARDVEPTKHVAETTEVEPATSIHDDTVVIEARDTARNGVAASGAGNATVNTGKIPVTNGHTGQTINQKTLPKTGDVGAGMIEIIGAVSMLAGTTVTRKRRRK